MPVRTEDERQMARKVLSSINVLTRLGAVDATVSGNATVTLLIAAVLNLPNTIGSDQGSREAVARGLRLGTLCGALAETHTASTIVGLRNIVAAQVPDVAADFAAELPG